MPRHPRLGGDHTTRYETYRDPLRRTSRHLHCGAVQGDDDIRWLSTGDAARRLGITSRTLYRFIDEGDLPAYRFGRVIRLQQADVEEFIDRCRIEPGTLEHLYPESTNTSSSESSDT